MTRADSSGGTGAASAVLLQAFRVTVVMAAGYRMLVALPTITLTGNEFALLLALFAISLLDIGLAQRDTADVDTALLVAGIYLYGGPTVLVMCTVVRVLVHMIMHRGRGLTGLVDSLTKRYAAVLVAMAALEFITRLRVGPMLDIYAHVVLLGAVFALIQLLSAQLGRAGDRGDSVLRLLLGNLVLQGPLVAAGISLAVLLVVISEDMGPWGVALTLLLLFTMRQSFALLLDIRSSYQATIEALVGAMDAQQTVGRGSGEYCAALARAAATEIGWFGTRVERIGYAALLHYYGLSLHTGPPGQSDNPLADVEFLRPVKPILAVLEGLSVDRVRIGDLKSAYIVERAVEDHVHDIRRERIWELEESLSSRWVAKVTEAIETAREM